MNSVVCFPKNYRQKDDIKVTHFEAVGNMTLKNCEKLISFFNVLLTVHLSITLVNNQLDPQFTLFYNTFITVLYMFRATSCSSSGQIVLIQGLVSSLSVSGCPTATFRE